MRVTRRGGLAALLGLSAGAVVPGTATALVPGATRPDQWPEPVTPARQGVSRMTRRVTKRAVREATRQPRNRRPPP